MSIVHVHHKTPHLCQILFPEPVEGIKLVIFKCAFDLSADRQASSGTIWKFCNALSSYILQHLIPSNWQFFNIIKMSLFMLNNCFCSQSIFKQFFIFNRHKNIIVRKNSRDFSVGHILYFIIIHGFAKPWSGNPLFFICF